MSRLLRIHFASIGHPDARLAPLTVDLRAHDETGTGADTVLWLRNGGGKSTILNLFYSLFRPDRREFLGSSAEGKARHLEDYVKADDLAFVVTEWDVDPISNETLFARPPARRRLVGQVMSWKDRQRSSDASKLRRRFFSLLADSTLGLEDLPIEGLSQVPVRSWDAFRDWLDELRHGRPELEAYWEDTARKWTEHLERISLDPELFCYQLKMNAREGSADEAFRFRTTDEFVRFYLEIAFDAAEADQVSANVEAFNDKLARRPDLLLEQNFLIEARHQLIPLREAVAGVRSAEALDAQQRAFAAALGRALTQRASDHRAVAADAQVACERAKKNTTDAGNAAARLGRWANGLDRRALELDLQEAVAAHEAADAALAAAEEDLRVAQAAVARDERHRVQSARDAKETALRLAEAEQEPLRRQVARAGRTLRARLEEAAAAKRAEAVEHAERQVRAGIERKRCDDARNARLVEDAGLGKEIEGIDQWLAERDRERESLRAQGVFEVREEAREAVARWRAVAMAAQEEAAKQAVVRDEARERARTARDEANERARAIAAADVKIASVHQALEAARATRARLQESRVVREIEGVDAADLDAPGLVDRVRSEAEAAHRRVLVAAVDGAEDERAWQALERTGRLPAAADVERALAVLTSAGAAAWSGPAYLEGNLSDPADREALVRSDPAAWHGVVVPDAAALVKAEALLATFTPRMPVTVAAAVLDAKPVAPDRVVLPGHAAHWDTRAGGILRDEIGERRKRRDRERDEHLARQHAARDAAGAIERWRADWGDGRLAVAESDQEQRIAARERHEADRLAAAALAEAADAAARNAETDRTEAEKAAAAAERRADRAQAFVERFELQVEAQRERRSTAEARRAAIATELPELDRERARHDDAWLAARDAAAGSERASRELLAERDAVDLFDDEGAPDAEDLVQARAIWSALRGRWGEVVSENRLQWELDQLEAELKECLVAERAASAGRVEAVAAVPLGAGEGETQRAAPLRETANRTAIAAELAANQARVALGAVSGRRRDAEDLPSDEPAPAIAAEARERAERCRAEREVANQREKREREEAAAFADRQRAASGEADQCDQRVKRVRDAVGEGVDGELADLPESSAAVDALVDERVVAVQRSSEALASARRAADRLAEALRDVALATAHEAHRSQVKERLKAPAGELAAAAEELHRDVEDRLTVVRSTLEDVDQHRRLVLQELDKIAMDGVRLLQAADRASRLPAGLGVWEGESFLRIRVDVPGGQAERQARLEPLLDRLVAKGIVPAGRELVDAAVRELGGQRIEATLLKPDAVLRRERLPVTEMQTFSRGQQLTVAILLYCTMARLRAQERGRGNRPDSGVLLLDNPVGTCSSVALLEMQRQVARQMRVQLVYTTGVNDPNAVATFPNTVRLRNAHRERASGDLRVTVESGGVEAIRVVATP